MADQLPVIEVTKTVFTVLDFLEWQRAGQLNLRPYFQRGSVWTPKARSFLIDTLTRGYPLPVLYLQNKLEGQPVRSVKQVIDGQQRLRAILSFIDPTSVKLEETEEPVKILRVHNPSLAGAVFDDLEVALQDRLLSTELSVHMLPARLSDRVLLDLFARMNSTGEKLNEQELRNAKYHGAFKTLAYELAYSLIETWKSWGTFTPRAMAQMRDVEFTSELMLLLLRGVQSKSRPTIDGAYRDMDDEVAEEQRIREAIDETFAIMRRAHDRAPELFKSQSWTYAIFALVRGGTLASNRSSLMGQSPATPASQLVHTLMAAQARLKTASDLPEDVMKAVRGASTDRGSRVARINFLADSHG